jgi:hypothetical protein
VGIATRNVHFRQEYEAILGNENQGFKRFRMQLPLVLSWYIDGSWQLSILEDPSADAVWSTKSGTSYYILLAVVNEVGIRTSRDSSRCKDAILAVSTPRYISTAFFLVASFLDTSQTTFKVTQSPYSLRSLSYYLSPVTSNCQQYWKPTNPLLLLHFFATYVLPSTVFSLSSLRNIILASIGTQILKYIYRR